MKCLVFALFTICLTIFLGVASGNIFAYLSTDRDIKNGKPRAGSPPACPPNGLLDETFNGIGVVMTTVGSGDGRAFAMALQPDQKIVVAGYAVVGTAINFGLERYNSDGSLDLSFGTNGKVTTPVQGIDDQAFAVAIQPDGKIVAVGATKTSGFDYDWAVVRYNSDGSLDTSWGSGTGKVVTAIRTGSTAEDKAYGVAIQSDGKVVAAGYSENVAHNGSDTTVVRYDPDGSLDTSFGTTGIVVTNVAGADRAYSLAIQPDGKIVTGGSGFVRYNSNGTLDTSFGNNGKVAVSILVGYLRSIAIQSDGKIVATGNYFNGSSDYDFAVLRYNANGTRDTNWGTNGLVWTHLSPYEDDPFSLALQEDGKVIVAGFSVVGALNGKPKFTTVRYNTNGTLDPIWGGTGIVITSLSDSYDDARAVAIQNDGKIVVAGFSNVSGTNNWNIAVVRYSGCGIRTSFDFDDDQRADAVVFRPSTGVWYMLQSTAGYRAVSFGDPTDIIAPADFDGDRKADIAVFRPSTFTWYWLESTNMVVHGVRFGATGDIPLPSDIDGDGHADFVNYRPSDGTWYRMTYGTLLPMNVAFGAAGDKPLIADFDGDGKADPAIFRPSTGTFWYAASSQGGAHRAVQWGISTDVPVVADYDGDGKSDFAVYRPAEGAWYVLQSTTNSMFALQFGIAEDKPIPADYDGDGKADVAVYRPSTGIWYLLRSTSGFAGFQWGLSTDIPSPAAYIPQ